MFRVLLVDDEVFFRQGLREIIDWQSSGFEVIGEADNGEDALTFILEHKPDVVITDIRMPVCDGLELIRLATQLETTSKFIIVSGYDEFRYAQQAVKYGVCDFLLKPIDEMSLQETLTQLSTALKNEQQIEDTRILYENEELMYELLSQEWDDQQLVAKYNTLELNYHEEYSFVFIEINDYPNIKANERYKNQLVKVIAEAAQYQLPELKRRYIFPLRGKVAVLINYRWLSAHCSIQSTIKQIQTKLSEELNTKVLIYSGMKASGLYFFEEAYRSVLVTSQYKYLDKKMIFYAESLAHLQLKVSNDTLSQDDFKQLLAEVEKGDEPLISEEIEKLFKSFTVLSCSNEIIKSIIHKIVAETLQTLQTMQIDSHTISSLTEVLHWDNYNITRDELIEIVSQYLLEVSRLIALERKEMAKGGIQRIKKYIDTNYSENISLKTIASKFYINPVYLGQLFKKTYDVYFNDYLLQVRIQEAKKMLRQTDLRIYEIAEKVGFNHAEYFVAQFEKIEKLSPTSYRQTFNKDLGEAK